MDINKTEEVKEKKNNNLLKYSIGLILVIIFIIIIISNIPKKENIPNTSNNITDSTDVADWQDFNSKLGSFQVSFPEYPSHKTIPFNVPRNNELVNFENFYVEQSNGTIYSVTFSPYPEVIDTHIPKKNLEESLNGALLKSNGTLISSDFSTFGTYQANDYLIYIKDMDFYIKGKDILVGQNLYQLIVVYDLKNYKNVQYDKFINSFKIN